MEIGSTIAINIEMDKQYTLKVTVLSGGVGGTKLVAGMARCIPPSHLSAVVNTADDAVFHGLRISPDLDTMMYTLAGIVNRETGWGIYRDTYFARSFLEKYGEETWFRLGDRDLATHILRTKLLNEGKTLTEITSLLVRKNGVNVTILPMTDENVQTIIKLNGRWFSFQEYFVRKGAKDVVEGFRFKGIRSARPTQAVANAVNEADLIVFAPSNPIVSLLPILSLPGFKKLLKSAKAFKVAVSPFISNRAISGPAKQLIEAAGYEGSSLGLAKLYSGMIDLMVVHDRDADKKRQMQLLGIDVLATQTIMKTEDDKTRLARKILNVYGII